MRTLALFRPERVKLVLAILVVVLCGCGGKQTTYLGRPVAEERQIALLDGGPHEAWWGAPPVAIKYRYRRQASGLQLSGIAELNRGGVVDTFFLTVHFIDAQGRINASHPLVTAAGRRQQQRFSFDVELPLKLDTRSMIFSFSGATRGVGQGSGSLNEFWQTP